MKRGGDDSDSENEEHNGDGSQLKAFKGLKKLRRRFERHPDEIVQEHVERMKLELGIVHDSQFWKVTGYCRRVQPQFKQLRGLLRCYFSAGEALQEYLTGRPHHMAATVVLLMEALHQVASMGGIGRTEP